MFWSFDGWPQSARNLVKIIYVSHVRGPLHYNFPESYCSIAAIYLFIYAEEYLMLKMNNFWTSNGQFGPEKGRKCPRKLLHLLNFSLTLAIIFKTLEKRLDSQLLLF